MTFMPTDPNSAAGNIGFPQPGISSTLNSLSGNPMLLAGLGLLSAGRDRRIDPFQSAAQGLLTGAQFQSQQQQQQRANSMQDQQFGLEKQKYEFNQQKQQQSMGVQGQVKGLLDAGDQEGAAKVAIASGDPSLTAWGAGLLTPKRPAQLQEFDAYAGMSPEQQAQYKDFTQIGRKDATPYYTPLPTSGGYVTFNNRTGQYEAAALPGGAGGPVAGGSPQPGVPVSPQQPILPIAADINLAGSKAAAEAAGTATGKNRVEAASDLPRVETNASATLKLLNNLQNHPGRDYATGIYSLAPTVPGTKQADFISMLDQLNGQSFLQAFQSLKGGGQITEVEGKKATDAIQRIKRAQTKEGFDEGVQELRDMVNSTRQNARQKTGQPINGQPPVVPANSGGWGIQEVKP